MKSLLTLLLIASVYAAAEETVRLSAFPKISKPDTIIEICNGGKIISRFSLTVGNVRRRISIDETFPLKDLTYLTVLINGEEQLFSVREFQNKHTIISDLIEVDNFKIAKILYADGQEYPLVALRIVIKQTIRISLKYDLHTTSPHPPSYDLP